jgi:hypothetical protein
VLLSSRETEILGIVLIQRSGHSGAKSVSRRVKLQPFLNGIYINPHFAFEKLHMELTVVAQCSTHAELSYQMLEDG